MELMVTIKDGNGGRFKKNQEGLGSWKNVVLTGKLKDVMVTEKTRLNENQEAKILERFRKNCRVMLKDCEFKEIGVGTIKIV